VSGQPSQGAPGTVSLSRDGAAAWIRLDRPATLNALDAAAKQALLDALAEVAEDPAVRVVALTGSGRAFCVGQDLRELASLYEGGSTPDFRTRLEEHYNPIVRLLTGMPKPTVACVNGVAAGAGLSLALACDLRLASSAATFALAFTGIGLIPDAGSTWHLPRIVGLGPALELALLGERVDAGDALRLGLVSRVWPAETFADEAAATVARLAAGATGAYGLTKRLLRENLGRDLPDALDAEAAAQAKAGASADHREGVAAFLAKRPPTFSGR
jgi:2-(1,2-epoxy-1,2-dihydrophenyl)acetyl-CoA isomerase